MHEALKKYHAKRDFNKTPEPAGKKVASGKKLSFVVQQHHARQMHYDFRLEVDGVLKSWAVPKGPSMDPHVHHLAVMTEDHPYEYKDFEGVIPQGSYGAGNVIIWDKGEYSPLNNGGQAEVREGLKKGHITFFLFGQKLQGEFALIQLKNSGDNDAWLLVKKGDSQATTKDITKKEESVISGKKVDEVGVSGDIKDAPKKGMPQNVTPMLCTLVDKPFDDKTWIYELKWDGFRAIGTKNGKLVQLYSRNGLDFKQRFAKVTEALRNLKDNVVLDGEVVMLDQAGHAHFDWLHDPSIGQGELYYYAFDILWLNGHDLTKLPLLARKKILKKALPAHSTIRYSDHIVGLGKGLYKQAQKSGLEGIVAKKASSTYQPGVRGLDWQKIKTHLRQEAVIGGFSEPRGSRKFIGSLILGVYSRGKLKYIGHSGGGIATNELKSLHEKLVKLEQADSPFGADTPKLLGKTHWVKPKLVCEASFSEWTPGGTMRHPVFEGLRPDKKPKDVRRESAKTKR